MKRRVRWKDSALGELTTLWTEADSEARRSITTAVDAIERELLALGERAGESRSGAERIMFHAPVAVLFEAEENEPNVFVLQIWLY